MKKAQLFSEDIIFAIVLVIFIFSLWLAMRERVQSMISTSEDKREIDEAASNAMSQLVESDGVPPNWNTLTTINETTVGSIGLANGRNVLDSGKVTKFMRLLGGHANASTLSALWHFDEGSGTTIYDSSGNGNTGTFAGMINWVTGKFGNAVQFTGGQYIGVSSSNSLNISGPLTVELWFTRPALSVLDTWMLNKANSDSDKDSNYEIWVDSSSKIRAGIGNGTTYQNVTSASATQLNTWYHVAFTADGTTLKLYINGLLDGSVVQSVTPTPNSQQLLIGLRSINLQYSFIGTIDEVAIYSRAKSASEIAADYTDAIASDSDYTAMAKFLGLNRQSYGFNFTITSLSGNTLYSANYTASATSYNASYAAVNTTASIERFALLNNSLVKLTLGVWIG
ncbi:hypothetical protein H0N99_03095 [Candidatus Micrarchaeota archaeon]|nr:hypothetical protein [Candidatus Micrarchaeota archaeon]